ncbi:hypothetical protein, partial [Sphingomonas faeni]|uniref:hypothetical protein n=2 Tax=Sphingomonas TaxID=13687 RepID=UPI00334AC237
WSSPVARQAHNLKVTGSNPVPATNSEYTITARDILRRLFVFVIQRIVPTSKYAPAQIDREIAAFRRQHHCLDERAQPFERLRSQRPVAVWLFTIERKDWWAKRGRLAAVIGPLPTESGPTLAADYLRLVFSPGVTAQVHIHSGPKAFFALTVDTCLATPEGTQVGRGPGNSLMIRPGPPMLLMAVGKEERRGFAFILHDATKSPTILTQQWRPQGSCARLLALACGR